jgi:hypothetical protein
VDDLKRTKCCLVQPPIHQVLRREDEAVSIVMRKYRVEQAAGQGVDGAVKKTQAKCPHLLIPENLRVKRVDVMTGPSFCTTASERVYITVWARFEPIIAWV